VITRETDYAIRACLYLSRRAREGGERVSTAEIAREMDIPYRFLRNLILRLARAGVLRSRRGRGGGVSLAHSPGKLTVLDVVRVMAPESTSLNRCLPHGGACSRSGICTFRRALRRVQEAIDHKLGAMTFDRLC
jgi:Rrf2 family nitric oxide-sensitive transcriptional repressor